VNDTFRKFAHTVSELTGTPWVFIVALAVLVVWALTGPIFGFSDTWQLVINTGTTIITFLMVFLIQNTQNRDARAIHLKLDELIRSIDKARNTMLDLEHLSDEELARIQKEFERLRDRQSGAVVEAADDVVEAVVEKRSKRTNQHRPAHSGFNRSK
jgi:low affinity Fe/Cu permease